MKLLQITGDENVAWEILGEYAGLFGDNGGVSDGTLYLADVDDIGEEELAAILASGEAVIVNGFEAEYAAIPMVEVMDQFLRGDWCGYSCGDYAYFIEEADAALSNEVAWAWEEDQDLDTIGHRIHGLEV